LEGSRPVKLALLSARSSALTGSRVIRSISARMLSTARPTLAGLTPAITRHGPGPDSPSTRLYE
jgi:hypothetical protein